MLISYPPEKLIRVGGRLLPRLNTDFNSVTSLIQVFIEVFYMVLVGVFCLFVKCGWNFGIWLESQKIGWVMVKVLIVVVVVYIIDI